MINNNKRNQIKEDKLLMNNKLATSSPLSYFFRGSYSSINKNSSIKPGLFEMSMISSSHLNKNNNNYLNQDKTIKRKLLFTHINDSIDKVKQSLIVTKQQFENNRKEINNVSNYLLNIINELSPQKSNLGSETKRSMKDQSKEIIDSIHKPLTYRKQRTNFGEFDQKNKHISLAKSSSCSNLNAKNNSATRSTKSKKDIPQSCQKIERMKKHIDGLFNHNHTGIRRNLFNNQDDAKNNYSTNNKPDIFQPSYRRKITNQIYDIKKLQIFVDYNARKENPENLKQFAKNNLQIIKTIKEKCKNIENEKKENELDVDIDVDDLLEDDQK